MVKEYTKGSNQKLSEHFYSDDFKCSMGSLIKIDDELVKLLEKFYSRGVRVSIVSGYRTEEYNNYLISLGYMASKSSYHMKGMAADIALYDKAGNMLSLADHCCLAQLCGAKGIGIMNTNVHVDVRPNKAYFHENYSSGNHEAVSSCYTFFKTTEEEFKKKYPIVATNLAGVTGKYKLVVNSLDVSDVTTNSATFTADLTDKFKSYGWCYSIDGNKRIPVIRVVSSQPSFEISNLQPDTTYTVALVAKEGLYTYSTAEIPTAVLEKVSNDFSSQPIRIRTKKAQLPSVEKVDASFTFEEKVEDSICELHIQKPSTVGAIGGYTISLLVNGEIVGSSDSLLSTSSERVSFKLKQLKSKLNAKIGDNIQIGVQTWKSSGSSKIFDAPHPVCSSAYCIQAPTKKIDKIFVSVEDAFKRVILNRTK